MFTDDDYENIDTPQVFTTPSYKLVHRRNCVLLTLTWERNWNKVVERCQSHPSEACLMTEDSGRTALHLAMFNQGCPSFVAKALLIANRHASIIQDKIKGYTPLHYASLFKCGSTEVIALLCHAVTQLERIGIPVPIGLLCQATEVEKPQSPIPLPVYGDIPLSPLFLACQRGASFETIRILLSCVNYEQHVGLWIAPITGGESCYSYAPINNGDGLDHQLASRRPVFLSSPLSALFTDNRDWDGVACILIGNKQSQLEPLRVAALEVISECYMSTGTDTIGRSLCRNQDAPTSLPNESFLNLWRKSILLVVSACNVSSLQHYRTISLLHAISALEIPVKDLLECAAAVFPEQLIQRDEYGLVPLHHVIRVSRPTIQFHKEFLLSSSPIKFMICELLNKNASAARITVNGSLPIALAIQSGISWCEGLRELAMAAPEALLAREVTLHLYPFLLAAAPHLPENEIGRSDDVYVIQHGETEEIASSSEHMTTIFRLLTTCPEVVGYHLPYK